MANLPSISPIIYFFSLQLKTNQRFPTTNRFHVEHCRPGWRDRTAWACLRLDRLQEGYRLVKLKDDDGYTTDGVLLVKVEKRVTPEEKKKNKNGVMGRRRRRTASLRMAARAARTWDACREGVVGRMGARWSFWRGIGGGGEGRRGGEER